MTRGRRLERQLREIARKDASGVLFVAPLSIDTFTSLFWIAASAVAALLKHEREARRGKREAKKGVQRAA